MELTYEDSYFSRCFRGFRAITTLLIKGYGINFNGKILYKGKLVGKLFRDSDEGVLMARGIREKNLKNLLLKSGLALNN